MMVAVLILGVLVLGFWLHGLEARRPPPPPPPKPQPKPRPKPNPKPQLKPAPPRRIVAPPKVAPPPPPKVAPKTTAEQLGKDGEQQVIAALDAAFRGKACLLNDLTLKTAHGTSQIDHVLIHPAGVFVIETKNYKGDISGGLEDAQWCQQLGAKRFHFYNPLKQNQRHCEVLAARLGLTPAQCISLVVFVGHCQFKGEKPKALLLGVQALVARIERFRRRCFSAAQCQALYQKAQQLRLPRTEETRALHIENVQRYHHQRQCPRCPTCGAAMRKCQGKYGPFWGCSRYPSCHGSKEWK